MDLQISVVLLFILFNTGHSLLCYQCTGLKEFCAKERVLCPFSAPKCVSSTIVVDVGAIRSKMKISGCSLGCESGSMNLGILKSSHFCCSSSYCNYRDAPDPNLIFRNGKTCYYCDGHSCSNILSCSGSEDHCITATGTVEGLEAVVKGCASKSVCDSKTLANSVHDISCCKGNLCNGDESVTQIITQSVTESVTQSFIQNVTHSFMNNGDKTVTQNAARRFIQSVTQSFVFNNAEIVKYSDAKNVKKSFMYNDKSAIYNGAESVTQSVLFLCCSLLSFILLH